MKVKKLTLSDPSYPEPLRHIYDPPKNLFTVGDVPSLLRIPRVAIVGSRKVTPYGRRVTARFAEELARAGVVIVSGLALGVDSIAHSACLQAGGKTVAVLPTGLDNIYPASHRNLAKKILEQGGALITEYGTGQPGLKHQFIERNRIVSGISDGVLITEAAAKSGTLHTANFALEQGKTVMAVPGNIDSPTSAGTNSLIKNGAAPITDTSDILSALGIEANEIGQQQLPLGANREEQLIIDLIHKGITETTELHGSSGLDPRAFNQTMTMLEISGKIRAVGGSQWHIL